MEDDFYLIFVLTLVISISLITMLTSCLCCKKKVPKNEFLGLEGMVKLKNPDEQHISNGDEDISFNSKGPNSDVESKRASNAPHRSLPDIPISEPIGDTGSELYATVGDKAMEEKKPQQIRIHNMPQLTSVSQHSSLSQADDVSSPYARVRSPLHAYDKVKPAEHPYAQLKTTTTAGTSSNLAPPSELASEDDDFFSIGRDESNRNGLESIDGQLVIPAASAIAGRISASQELPYMTPPIVSSSQQNFSGDSQDSSKGYTSISVREPLANIIAQTNRQNAMIRRRNLTDSHYATVSDDSDEMYAAIEDSNNQVDLYTSGSETYAQILPPTALTVSVEINTVPSPLKIFEEEVIPSTTIPQRQSTISNPEEGPAPPIVENLRNMHSRQASSSSCTGSISNLGSPKPEKRQANSPLPPTPKNQHYLSNSNLTSSSSIPSGRNSATSIIEVTTTTIGIHSRQISRENLAHDIVSNKSATLGSNSRLQEQPEEDLSNKKHNLSKDLEGMYAKVMKKTKFSSVPSQNVLPGSSNLFASDPDLTKNVNYSDNCMSKSDNNYETIRKNATNQTNTKDPGYETIPSEKRNFNITVDAEECSEPRYESLPLVPHSSGTDPCYETVIVDGKKESSKPNSDYDPNYEILRPTEIVQQQQQQNSKIKADDDDGYSSIKNTKSSIVNKEPGYSSIDEISPFSSSSRQNHDYASISEEKKLNFVNNNVEIGTHNYSTISETHRELHSLISINTTSNSTDFSKLSDCKTTPSSDSNNSSEIQIGYNSIRTDNESQINSSNYESLTGSESDPNYESVRYIDDKENPYERLQNDLSTSPLADPASSNIGNNSRNFNEELTAATPTTTTAIFTTTTTTTTSNSDNVEVSDYFQV